MISLKANVTSIMKESQSQAAFLNDCLRKQSSAGMISIAKTA